MMKFTAKKVTAMEKVLPSREPSDEGMREQISGLKGETVSYQIACYAEPEGFIRGDVEVISPVRNWVRVRTVELVPCDYPCGIRRDEDYLATEPGMYPDRLEDLKELGDTKKSWGIPLLYGQWRSLWVDVEIPEDAAAGTYSVEICIRAGQELLASVPMEVKVINAVLPALKIPHTEWFHSDCLANYYEVEVFSEEYWRIVENFVRTAVKRKYNMLLTPIFTPPLDTAVGGERRTVQLVDVEVLHDGTYAFGFENFERWVEMGKRCGIKFFEMSHLFTQWGAKAAPKIMAKKDGVYQRIFGWETDASGAEYGEFLHQFLTALKKELERLEIASKTYFHISDEPSMEHMDSYCAAKKTVAKDLEGYQIFDALSDYNFYEQGLVEQPVCSMDHIQTFLDHREAEGEPKKLWGYYCVSQAEKVTNRFIVQPAYRTRILGVQMYKYKLDGFLHWGYNFYNSIYSLFSINPYQSTDAGKAFPSGDPFVVYPGKNGKPEESIRLMMMYEAMADLCAMNLLEELCGREAVLECIEADQVTMEVYPRNREYLAACRERVNERIGKAVSSNS